MGDIYRVTDRREARMKRSLDGEDCALKTWLLRVVLALSGVAAFIVLGVTLDRAFGIGFDTTYRLACAGACLILIAYLARYYRGERWPWIALALALLVNVALFFTPLLDRSASRGEIMFFALPDAILFLIARTVTYRVTDVHTRAVWQQLILALVVAALFCALLFGLTLSR
jgi:hypothetical protein